LKCIYLVIDLSDFRLEPTLRVKVERGGFPKANLVVKLLLCRRVIGFGLSLIGLSASKAVELKMRLSSGASLILPSAPTAPSTFIDASRSARARSVCQ
jgi:hypothetical protein